MTANKQTTNERTLKDDVLHYIIAYTHVSMTTSAGRPQTVQEHDRRRRNHQYGRRDSWTLWHTNNM